jgi:hypothetical protein
MCGVRGCEEWGWDSNDEDKKPSHQGHGLPEIAMMKLQKVKALEHNDADPVIVVGEANRVVNGRNRCAGCGDARNGDGIQRVSFRDMVSLKLL